LKAVPEGIYDAVIVDSSDPVGKDVSQLHRLLIQNTGFVICIYKVFNQWQGLFVQGELCVLKQKVYGFTWTSLRVLWQTVARYLKALSTMHGPRCQHTQGILL
jgi:hypothetical protein